MHEVHIGVTGTRFEPTQHQLTALASFFQELTAVAKDNDYLVHLHHGDCVGADVAVAEIATGFGCKTICHPPTDEKLRAFHKSDIILPAKTYFARNRDIVDESKTLLVVPFQMEWQPHGGTWYTHDYAEKKDVFRQMFWPEAK